MVRIPPSPFRFDFPGGQFLDMRLPGIFSFLCKTNTVHYITLDFLRFCVHRVHCDVLCFEKMSLLMIIGLETIIPGETNDNSKSRESN